MNKADELAIKTIDILKIKSNEVRTMFRCNLTYDEKKKLDRVKVAIKHSIELLRRAKMDDVIPNVIKR